MVCVCAGVCGACTVFLCILSLYGSLYLFPHPKPPSALVSRCQMVELVTTQSIPLSVFVSPGGQDIPLLSTTYQFHLSE